VRALDLREVDVNVVGREIGEPRRSQCAADRFEHGPIIELRARRELRLPAIAADEMIRRQIFLDEPADGAGRVGLAPFLSRHLR
jgi:hypothetical protein